MEVAVTALSNSLPGFDEPLEMIEACHDRIEAQLGTLERLVPHVAAHGPDAAARQAAQAVMRYFDTAGEAHNQDEDEDLFPLVRAAAARDGRHEIGATLYELEREHENMDRLYSEVRARLDAIATGEAERGALDADLVARFAWIYRRHMQLESDLVLPYARQALESGECAMLAERMTARRRDQ
jgi:hemerythrin-like domain-containing protein